MRRDLNHRVCVTLHGDDIAKWVTTGFDSGAEAFRVLAGLPEGAQLVGAEYAHEWCSVRLYFVHPDLPPVERGAPIPRMDITCERSQEVTRLREALQEIARCAPPTREWESTRAYIGKVLGA